VFERGVRFWFGIGSGLLLYYYHDYLGGGRPGTLLFFFFFFVWMFDGGGDGVRARCCAVPKGFSAVPLLFAYW
jgi:hypothetical protein